MRYVLVSNRLPFTIKKSHDTYSYSRSSGGLATALDSFVHTAQKNNASAEFIWVGWPGAPVPRADQAPVQSAVWEKYHASPVFLTDKHIDTYYNGFCNQTLWPLFHYFITKTVIDPAFFRAYQEVNVQFAKHISSILKKDDIVFIHDYHLMLLPNLLRQKYPNLKIGFFLHTPFPAYDVFKVLPEDWQGKLLSGVLGANILGFHTAEYQLHFLEAAELFGFTHTLGEITLPTHISKSKVYPISISTQEFAQAAASDPVKKITSKLRREYTGQKLIFSVDRLDYTKGILHRLNAYKRLLALYPRFQGKVVFHVSIVPSRDSVPAYSSLKKKIESLVAEINSTFEIPGWNPIIYSYESLSSNDLSAKYAAADVALITPLRDGMNLVAKEFVASKIDQKGVLILSNFAGSSLELTGALHINPFDIASTAKTLYHALTMQAKEQKKRMNQLQQYLSAHTVFDWAKKFHDDLVYSSTTAFEIPATLTSSRKLLPDYQNAKSRLLLFDYDGTLTPIVSNPQEAIPTPELLTLLYILATDGRNTVAIVSGRDKDSLSEWFGKLPLTLVAEHGAWIKHKNKLWTPQISSGNTWKEAILPVLTSHCEWVPGSFIEEKDFSLAWHFRKTDPESSEKKARELTALLTKLLSNSALQVLNGNKVIEIKNIQVNKGTAAQKLILEKEYSCTVAIGDDRTDEDMFREINNFEGFTFKVGTGSSVAQYRLSNSYTVLKLLQLFANQTQPVAFI